MHTLSRNLSSFVAVLAVALLFPATTRAQASLTSVHAAEQSLRADRLDRQAATYEQTDWSMLEKAAGLRLEAARIRAAEDPKASMSFVWAARDRYYLGDTMTACRLMTTAGERALAIGDVLGAVKAFTDAAYIAAELRDGERASELVSRARLLSYSPMLTDDQRTQVRSMLASTTEKGTSVASADRR
jgi:hypothetical protein